MKKAIAIALAATTLWTGHAEAAKKKARPKQPPCVSEAMMQELSFRAMQSELMAAALACGAPFRSAYTSFVESNRPELATRGMGLRSAMKGGVDRYVTKAANSASKTLDCANAAAVYTQYDQGVPLASISSEPRFREMTGYRICAKPKA